jgi:hypothetical protein
MLYHKLRDIQSQSIEISDFEFVLTIANPYPRRVKYYLQCDPKKINCEESSNKVLPTRNPHGYIFTAA